MRAALAAVVRMQVVCQPTDRREGLRGDAVAQRHHHLQLEMLRCSGNLCLVQLKERKLQ